MNAPAYINNAAHELRRHAKKLDGVPCIGDARAVMNAAAAHIEDLERRLREAEATTAAARDVLAERRRQVEAEGWTPEHDDHHLPNELALAAASYVCADEADAPPAIWPWDWSWWKPKDRRRNLVKAGALILAEIERLDRIQSPKGRD